MINSIAHLINAIAPAPRTHDLTYFLRICAIADISPYDAADYYYSESIPSDYYLSHYPDHDPNELLIANPYPILHNHPLRDMIIDARNFLFNDDAPFDYFSDSCTDELTEMLDFDRISDNDDYALARRIESYYYDLYDDFPEWGDSIY